MPDSSDCRIEIVRNAGGEERIDPAVRIYYVFDGAAQLAVRERRYDLIREDLVLVNAMEKHALTIREKGVVCIISFDYAVISRYMPESGSYFSLNTKEPLDRPYHDIREIFRECIFLELGGEHRRNCRIMSRFYELLDILFRHCMANPSGQDADRTSRNSGKLSDSEKLQRILSYVNSHYQDTVSLREMAADMYLSTSTLSRFFRKQTGYYFADYLNMVRLMHAASELTSTANSVTKIALDCGFSNSSAFSRLFHDTYGISPVDYRKQEAHREESRQREREGIREELAERLREIRPEMHLPAGENSSVQVDVSRNMPMKSPWGKLLNIGSLSALTRANVQYHLLYLADELQVTHVKIWSVFAKDLRITDGKTIGYYNFSVIDTVLDVIVENKLAVYFDFGSRPDVIIGVSDTALYQEEVGVTFASRKSWESIFESFVEHLISRYGMKEIGRWIFDFCIDPTFRGFGSYYEDPDYDYQNVYEFAWKTLRRLVPEAKVGGPMAIPNSPKRELDCFLRKCSESGCRPDFISLPLLPYQPDENISTFHKNPDPQFEDRQLKMLRQLIGQYFTDEIPIYVSDWNLSLSNRNILNDSCMRGTYICSRAHSIMEYADMCSIWFASDWISNYYDTRKILNGSGGMLTQDNIRKPVFYASQFLGRLGQEVLFANQEMIVTRKDRRDYMILCSNQVHFNVGYYLYPEDEIVPDNMDLMVVSNPAHSMDLDLKGLEENAEYVIKTRSVSRNHGSILDEWKRLGYENRPEREDIKYLREICVPHLSMIHARVKNGKLHHRILLDEQEFQLIHIYRV